VETIHITTADTAKTATNPLDTLTLVAVNATTVTVAGNAGLSLADTGTAITSLDASGITKGSFSWTSSGQAANAVIHGSATGINTVNLAADTNNDTYTGGSGVDTLTLGTGNNTVSTGAGADNISGAATGNQTITTGDTAGVVVSIGAGNNVITVGGGAGDHVTVTNGNNTITVGGGAADQVTVGGGLNIVNLGTGAGDTVTVGAGLNVSTYTTVNGWATGDIIATTTAITEVGMVGATASAAFAAAKVTSLDPATATFQQFADFAVHNIATASGDAAWFQFGGNTYIVENATGGELTFHNSTDIIVKLTGLVDLSTATIAANHIVHG